MRTFLVTLFLVVLCVVATTVLPTHAATGFTVTAVLDYETYDSMSYIRFSIDQPRNLPKSSNTFTKLFDIQLPNAFTNIQERSAECTRDADLNGTPMFKYEPQTSESRGFELMYPSNFDANSSNFNTQLNCVIKIKAMPLYTGTSPKFTIKLLAATKIFAGSPLTNTRDFSFSIPNLVLTTTTSSRTFPQAFPFLYAKSLKPDDSGRYDKAPTTPDVYTTSLNIDQTLLSLRKNNKLIVTHPFPFEFVRSTSFCTSPHEITPYDFDAQAPVTEASTQTSAVNAISISLSSFSGSSNDVSCQISVLPVLAGDVTSYPAGQVKLFLEYSFYNKTGTSSFSNFYKTFTQRTFEEINPATLFPFFDPKVILATPPVALRHQLILSPVFLHPSDVTESFWNRYNIILETFAFQADDVLFIPQPDNLEVSEGACLGSNSSIIQTHNCVQLTAEQSCPDFDMQLGRPATAVVDNSHLGLLLFPKRNLRFTHSDCFYNFLWKKGNLPLQNNNKLNIRLLKAGDVTPVTVDSFRTFPVDDTKDWILPTPYTLTMTPPMSVSVGGQIPDAPADATEEEKAAVAAEKAAAAASFKSPFVGGQLRVMIKSSTNQPLTSGFRIEVQGPRLTRPDSAWLSKISYFTSNLDPVPPIPEIEVSITGTGSTCAGKCLRVTTELLPQRDSAGEPTGSSYYYPVLTYYGTNVDYPLEVTINYPGFQIPMTTDDKTAMQTATLWHFASQLVAQSLPMPNLISNPTNVFYTLSKEQGDVEDVFKTISWWTPGTPSAFVMDTQDSKMQVLQSPSASNTSNLGSNATGDEWFIYEPGYMGLLIKNTRVSKGDVMIIGDTSVILNNNSTTITNLIHCTGKRYEIGTPAWTPLGTNENLMIIETSSTLGITATFLVDLTETQAISCTATVTPRYPAIATELYQIPTLTYHSTLFAQAGSSIPSRYSTADYLSDASISAQNYPFTYELPVDITNLNPDTRALIENIGIIGQQDVIFTGSYIALSLKLAGLSLEVGSPSALHISFASSRLQAPDVDIVSALRLPIKPACPNADISISYQNSQTVVTVTLNQAVVATTLDPYVCQFVMMVGAGSTDSELATIKRGTDPDILGSTLLRLLPSPFEIGVTQSNNPGEITFAVDKIGFAPIILHNSIPFTTINPYCVSPTGQQIATVHLSQALGMIILQATDAAKRGRTDLKVENPIQDAQNNDLTCTFTATKKFNAASTSVRFQTLSLILPEVLTLPAISDVSDNGIDVTFSSITPPGLTTPVSGLLLDIFHQDFKVGDAVWINLPPGVVLGEPSSIFQCTNRLVTTPEFQRNNSTYTLKVSVVAPISTYDEVQCALPLKLNSPISKGQLQFITVKQTGGLTDSGQPIFAGRTYQSTLPQVSSDYRISTQFNLQWTPNPAPDASSPVAGQLDLLLDAIYTALSFNARSNTLTYDFGGMKSPSDPFNSTRTRYAGGDPTIRDSDPIHHDSIRSLSDLKNVGIRAGAAIISSKLTVADCYLPYTDHFGQIQKNHRLSSQYIRETGHKLIISLPNVLVGVPTSVQCIIPVYIYNQEFTITPRIIEHPTNQVIVAQSLEATRIVATWFPSPTIKQNPLVVKPTTPTQPQIVRPQSTPVKSAKLLRLQRSTSTSTLSSTSTAAFTPTSTDTLPIMSVLQSTQEENPYVDPLTLTPNSALDLTQDIRYMELLFVQPRFFDNTQLDDIVRIIHSLVSKRDRVISLNSLLILSQTRPPIDNGDEYVSLRIGFAGLDVESTLLEAKFAGLDFSHWLSTNYEVASYSIVDGKSGDYRYSRSKVPIECLKTAAEEGEITQTCGADCGRLCPNTYRNGVARVCRTDRDCESLNCDTDTQTCQSQQFNFVPAYTGVYTNRPGLGQYAITFQQAHSLVVQHNSSGAANDIESSEKGKESPTFPSSQIP